MKEMLSLGLDFGTESVRALLVDLRGRERATSVVKFRHGQITEKLPGTSEKLPPDFALQHPQDWLDSSARAVRGALRRARVDAADVMGIGVCFTSCTMLPSLADGTPLCLTKEFARAKFSWPKLWKHHGAKAQADRLNALAKKRKEKWLARYGGIVSLESFFPKVLETLENAPAVYEAADVWLEAGDWFVWRLVGGPASQLPRSTCQAGYKALWSRDNGFPSPKFLGELHPKLAHVVREKMPGRFLAPGECAGKLSKTFAARLGLREGLPVSAAIIDAHSGVPGAGAAEPETLVMVMGTSSCHMLNAKIFREVPGVFGIVQDGILPGLVGYETGQTAVGDAFDWLRRMLGEKDFSGLTRKAEALPPGADGVLCLDWFNGCRTPLMDSSLTGIFAGLKLHHRPEHLYRAMLEGSAFGMRWIVELLRKHGVPVKRFIATGGLPHHNTLLMEIYASVLGEKISIHPCKYGPALGAAIIGALAAGKMTTGFSTTEEAIRSMAQSNAIRKQTKVIEPDAKAARVYDTLYQQYRELAEKFRNHSK